LATILPPLKPRLRNVSCALANIRPTSLPTARNWNHSTEKHSHGVTLGKAELLNAVRLMMMSGPIFMFSGVVPYLGLYFGSDTVWIVGACVALVITALIWRSVITEYLHPDTDKKPDSEEDNNSEKDDE